MTEKHDETTTSGKTSHDPNESRPIQELAEAHGDMEAGEKTALEEALEAAENFKRIAQRAQADLVNFRNQVANDIEQVAQKSAKSVAFPLMEVCDQLESALDASTEKDVAEVWLIGMRSVYHGILSVLKDAGFERFDGMNCTFDPTRHDALLLTPTDAHAPGEIIGQIRAGYEYKGMVARPAQVEVAAEPDGKAK